MTHNNLLTTEHGSNALMTDPRQSGMVFAPRFDVAETADEILLWGDVPGVTPQSLEVRFENRELTVHGQVLARIGTRTLLGGEYGIGDFYRTFTIGEAIVADEIKAELKNGVLLLRLPKAPEFRPRRIPVKCDQADR